MDQHGKVSGKYNKRIKEEEMDLRRGPWTAEEDTTLINYISHHGEGRWNSLARCAGLRRTGKSCRLRWLNYLRPDLRRGSMSPEEQLLILELHSRWGNRWSKIAQYLPGRTDNEIKNYWRTRVKKHAKQLKYDVTSKQFKDTMRHLWMPRLVERIKATTIAAVKTSTTTHDLIGKNITNLETGTSAQIVLPRPNMSGGVTTYSPVNSSAAASTDSFGAPGSDLGQCFDNYQVFEGDRQEYYPASYQLFDGDQYSLTDSNDHYFGQELDFVEHNSDWIDAADVSDNLWDIDDMWFLQQ